MSQHRLRHDYAYALASLGIFLSIARLWWTHIRGGIAVHRIYANGSSQTAGTASLVRVAQAMWDDRLSVQSIVCQISRRIGGVHRHVSACWAGPEEGPFAEQVFEELDERRVANAMRILTCSMPLTSFYIGAVILGTQSAAPRAMSTFQDVAYGSFTYMLLLCWVCPRVRARHGTRGCAPPRRIQRERPNSAALYSAPTSHQSRLDR